jgi:outer membrane protein insertion porin family
MKRLKPLRGILPLLLMLVVMAGCSGTRHLPEGEKLYTGADIQLNAKEKVNKRQIKSVAKSAIRQAPNKSYLGMRPKLWLYMTARKEPFTKLGEWCRKNGEAPVLISEINPTVTAGIIDAQLFNIGLFKSYTVAETNEKSHTSKVIYTCYINQPYTIGSITFAIDHDSISHLIEAAKGATLIKSGDDYNLELFKRERDRIDAVLKNNGYFFFDPDYLLFKADTTGSNRTVACILTLKDSTPSNALVAYRINHVYIDQDYSLIQPEDGVKRDTMHYKNVVFAGKASTMNIRPAVILGSVYLRLNRIYSREQHVITLNRLMSMGSFKFVQVKFTESDTPAVGFLDVVILLTTMTRYTFRAEMDLVTKSNNFTGPRMNLSLLARNAFGGAELLSVSMAGSFEAQLSGQDKNVFSYSINPQAELMFPRFLVPFKVQRSNSIYVPKTTFLLSYQYLKRVNYFDMRNFQFKYGFSWKESIRKEHTIRPVNISYTAIRNPSAQFTAMLDANPFLKKSYEEQFIAGASYVFTYNEQVHPEMKLQHYLQLSGETVGNLFTLLKTMGGEKPTSGNPASIIGSVYSQFAKISMDARQYYTMNPRSKIALRFFAGVAKPYGNSAVLPYATQFFCGGPNSLRAFRINAVGPGTYDQDGATIGFLQLGGDIKLEMNAEYRFGIYRFVKGALFFDAGNVWLQKSNPSTTGSPFLMSTFMNELVVGAGIGLRMDVSFFILRFDFAIPLRKPWLASDERWVMDQIALGSGTWRKENLKLNIAIGYPF